MGAPDHTPSTVATDADAIGSGNMGAEVGNSTRDTCWQETQISIEYNLKHSSLDASPHDSNMECFDETVKLLMDIFRQRRKAVALSNTIKQASCADLLAELEVRQVLSSLLAQVGAEHRKEVARTKDQVMEKMREVWQFRLECGACQGKQQSQKRSVGNVDSACASTPAMKRTLPSSLSSDQAMPATVFDRGASKTCASAAPVSPAASSVGPPTPQAHLESRPKEFSIGSAYGPPAAELRTSGRAENGSVGSGPFGSVLTGSEPLGSGPIGSGPLGSGPPRSGPVAKGLAGSPKPKGRSLRTGSIGGFIGSEPRLGGPTGSGPPAGCPLGSGSGLASNGAGGNVVETERPLGAGVVGSMVQGSPKPKGRSLRTGSIGGLIGSEPRPSGFVGSVPTSSNPMGSGSGVVGDTAGGSGLEVQRPFGAGFVGSEAQGPGLAANVPL